MPKLVGSLVFLISFIGLLNAQTLSIRFSNVRSDNGVIRIGIFADQESYQNGNPVFYRTVSKFGMDNGELTVEYKDIKNGTYGIVALDDENSNDKTDYGLILPKEGFGFSNFNVSLLNLPQFRDFDFNFGTTDLTVTVKMKYL